MRLQFSGKLIRGRAAALGIFGLLAVVHTWPLASRPAVHSRVDNGDYSLNVWAVDWVAHNLLTNPAGLFDANIFHPSRLTLAYSEPLILQGALAMPGVWLGVPPVAIFNLVLVAGFALSGWAFALLVHRETGSWAAGLVAGSAVAFNAHTLVRLAHIQALHVELVALAFVALDRLLATARLRYAVFLGASVAVQATASIYLLVFTAWGVICAGIARAAEWRQQFPRAAVWAFVAAASCAVFVLPVLWPYIELSRSEGLVRSFGETQRCAATWNDYLYTGSRFHFGLWSRHFRDSAADANFPGLIVTGLAVFGLFRAGLSPRTRMWLGVVAGSVLLSMVPRLPGFEWLHEHVPGFGALRCYSRAGQMALVGMAVLAGYGAARLLQGIKSRRAAALAAAALVLGVNAEALRAPFLYRDFHGVPAIYDRLRDESQAVVVELPFYGRRAFFRNADYMINATRHRHPILNGYSGFAPRDFDATARALNQFPEPVALELLHRLGVTHIVVHDRNGMETRHEAIRASPSLRLVAEEGRIAIYRFVVH